VSAAVAEASVGRSWQPVDLTAALDGTYEPPRAEVGQRTDEVGLFYPGRQHTISSESEGGKTWLALTAVAQELNAGNGCLFVDFEDDEGGVVGRLLALQVDPKLIRDRFAYLRPEHPIGGIVHQTDLVAVLGDLRPTLAIVDGVTEAMTLHDLDPLSNTDVAKFGRLLPARLAAAGAAVVSLDHVPKSTDNRGRYAIGAQHKLAGLNGAAFVLTSRQPFGVGITGRSTLLIAKDRPGQLRRHALPSGEGLHWFADLTITSHDERFADAAIEPPTSHAAETFRPTTLMRRISEALEANPGGLSKRAIRAAVKGNNDAKDLALEQLVNDGHVTRTREGSAHRYLHATPYGQDQ
jgi:hypothetical protein